MLLLVRLEAECRVDLAMVSQIKKNWKAKTKTRTSRGSVRLALQASMTLPFVLVRVSTQRPLKLRFWAGQEKVLDSFSTARSGPGAALASPAKTPPSLSSTPWLPVAMGTTIPSMPLGTHCLPWMEASLNLR